MGAAEATAARQADAAAKLDDYVFLTREVGLTRTAAAGRLGISGSRAYAYEQMIREDAALADYWRDCEPPP